MKKKALKKHRITAAEIRRLLSSLPVVEMSAEARQRVRNRVLEEARKLRDANTTKQ